VNAELRAPFPWFGGKSRAAHIVWQAFGNVPNYVEPFYGSGAVLLGRPHVPKIETVNDADTYLANFWRATVADPEAVARFCDHPVNEADLHARHRWLVAQVDFRERMKTDPDFFDAKIAGWWVWGLSQWIGGGFCHVGGSKIWSRGNGSRPDLDGIGQGVHRKMPDLYTRGHGRGIRAAAPERGERPPTKKLPNLSSHGGKGTGTTRLPSLGNARGVHGAEKPPCLEWFVALRERLRRVRVCCGDWTRVLGDSVIGTTKSRNSGMNPCGVFLDPPYPEAERDGDLYGVDDGAVAHRVAEWAIEHGSDPDLRVAFCGYEGAHVFPATWTCVPWKAHRGYAAEGNDNKNRERIWFSPHCLPLVAAQGALFGEA
jgi:hypothetical protein